MGIVFPLNELVFPAAGNYRLPLYANGQFLRDRRVVVLPLPGPATS